MSIKHHIVYPITLHPSVTAANGNLGVTGTNHSLWANHGELLIQSLLLLPLPKPCLLGCSPWAVAGNFFGPSCCQLTKITCKQIDSHSKVLPANHKNSADNLTGNLFFGHCERLLRLQFLLKLCFSLRLFGFQTTFFKFCCFLRGKTY